MYGGSVSEMDESQVMDRRSAMITRLKALL